MKKIQSEALKNFLKNLFRILILSLIIFLLIYFLLTKIIPSTTAFFASISFFISLFLTTILMYNKYFLFKMDKKGIKTTAKVISCLENTELSEEPIEGVSKKKDDAVYEIQLGVNVNNEVRMVSKIVGEKIEVNNIINGYYLKNNKFVLDTTYQNFKKHYKNNKVKITVGIIISLLISLLLVFFSSRIEHFILYIIFLLFGMMIAFIGLSFIIECFKSKKDRKKCLKVNGTVIDNEVELHSSNDSSLGSFGTKNFYFPIYEFVYNGVKKIHKSSIGDFKAKKIGTTEILFYNEKENRIFANEEYKDQIVFGILSVITSITMIIWSIIQLLK